MMRFLDLPRALKRDRRGTALIEFAVAGPILILMYLAGYQLSDALSCNRKVTITARSVADLTTQNSTLTDGQTAAILNASVQVMSPYKSSNALVRVTELYTDANGNTTVVWSKAINGLGRTASSSYILPSNIRVNNTYIIMSEISYAYKPAVDFGIVGPLGLVETIYMNPRNSNSVDQV